MTAPRFTDEFLAELKARTSLVGLIGRYVTLRRRGREHTGCCPFHNERTPSFTVVEGKGFFHCFGCGAHGTALDFVMRLDGRGFVEAVEFLAAEAGMMPDKAGARKPLAPAVPRAAQADLDAEKMREVEKARKLWKAGRVAAATLVEVYLRARGIVLSAPPSLRFHPALDYWIPGDGDDPVFVGRWPGMLGAVQGPNGAVLGIHKTYLRRDGRGKADDLPVDSDTGRPLAAKKMGGECWGGAVRFDKAAPVMATGEGIETVLSVKQALKDPRIAFWAALSIGNIAGGGQGQGPRRIGKISPDGKPMYLPDPRPDMERPGIVLPPECRELIILEDADNKDPDAAEMLYQRAATRHAREGRTVRRMRPPAGHDFNDLVKGKAA